MLSLRHHSIGLRPVQDLAQVDLDQTDLLVQWEVVRQAQWEALAWGDPKVQDR